MNERYVIIMKTKQKIYYQYVVDIKEATCTECSDNDTQIFYEETKPNLPVHPNCNCKLVKLEYYEGELPDLSNIEYGQWCVADESLFWNKLPHEYSYPWIRIMLSKDQYIFYTLDREVLITNDGLKTIEIVNASDELIEFLMSLKATSMFREESLYIKNVQMTDPLAKPIYIERDNTHYFKMDDDTVLEAHMTYLAGMGVLPDGTIIVGQYGSRVDKLYYYELLLLRNQYTVLKNSDNLSEQEYQKRYMDIRREVLNLIQDKNPDLDYMEVEKKYKDAWESIPDDYYVITDVTKEINNIIESYLNSKEWKFLKNSNFPPLILNEFRKEVQKGAPLDLKNQPEWYHPLYIYEGEIVDVDALGNILYGVLGAYLDIDERMLLFGASVAQSTDNKELQLDDRRDVMRWKQGYNMYFNKWYEGDDSN